MGSQKFANALLDGSCKNIQIIGKSEKSAPRKEISQRLRYFLKQVMPFPSACTPRQRDTGTCIHISTFPNANIHARLPSPNSICYNYTQTLGQNEMLDKVKNQT